LFVVAAGTIGAVLWWTSGDTVPPSPAAPVVSSPQRALTYSLTVQSFADGRYKEPFTLSGEMLFRNRDRIRLNINSPQSGHLYIVNEGPRDEHGEASYNILFPSPTANAGSAQLSAGQEVQIPRQSWFELDAKEGTEFVWLIWSAGAIAELESAKRFANPEDRGRIKDADLVRSIASIVNGQQQKASVERDDNKKESHVTGDGDTVVHLIKLEHH
jgi:hypothetical protein